MTREIIATQGAPSAVGPYSQGIKTDNLIFVSGQLPLNAETGEFISDDIKRAVRQCILNLKAILEAGGSNLDNVVKTTVFLTDLGNFAAANEAYAEFFSNNPPSRSCFEVSKLPKDAIVEIEAVAVV